MQANRILQARGIALCDGTAFLKPPPAGLTNFHSAFTRRGPLSHTELQLLAESSAIHRGLQLSSCRLPVSRSAASLRYLHWLRRTALFTSPGQLPNLLGPERSEMMAMETLVAKILQFRKSLSWIAWPQPGKVLFP